MEIKSFNDNSIYSVMARGKQEKFYDAEYSQWYKLDQYGYESLAETLASRIMRRSKLNLYTPYTFVAYRMEHVRIHDRIRTACSCNNFLSPHSSIITVNDILQKQVGYPLKNKLDSFTTLKRKTAYIVDATRSYTRLYDFADYLTLIFELDALFCNDDRTLNNIAVIEKNGVFNYCPIFDNGAAFLSNIQMSPLSTKPQELLTGLTARPTKTSFGRQVKAVHNLYGRILEPFKISNSDIYAILREMLNYYPKDNRESITNRIITCINNGKHILNF